MRDFRHSLPMALLRAREAVMKQFRHLLKQHGELTEQQWRILRALAEAGELEATQLAAYCQLLPSSLSRTAKNLEARGLLRRRQEPGDQRLWLFSLSTAGSQLFHRVTPHVEQCYAGIAEALGRQRLDELYDLLEALEAALTRQP